MTQPATPTDSPLSDLPTDTIAELMARDPLGLQDQDLDAIIEYMRALRQRWMDAEAQGRRPKTPSKTAPQKDFNLDEIGL